MYNWKLTYDGSGGGVVEVSYAGTTLFTRTFMPSAGNVLRTGNAIRLHAKASADATGGSVAVNVNRVNGLGFAANLSAVNHGSFVEQKVYLFSTAFGAGFSIEGDIALSFSGAAPPRGSRLNFLLAAGNVSCA